MKNYKIRKNVYETNSSSTHSVTISDSGDYDSIESDYEGKILVDFSGDYGWDYREYSHPVSRLDYISIYARDWSGDRTQEFLQAIKDVVEWHTGAEVIFDLTGGGYIDHQSVEQQDYHYIIEDSQKLKDFIFAKGSSFTTDNDNH